MTKFNPFTIDSRETIESFFKNSNTHLAELNFTNLFTWSHAFHPSWAVINDSLTIRLDLKEGPSFTMPIGNASIEPVFRELEKISSACHVPLCIRSVSEEQLPEISEMFPDVFDISIRESYSDYIYTTESLASLAGKKLHGKRNHINRFEMFGPWHTEIVTEDKLDSCRLFADEWFQKNTEEKDMAYDSEQAAIDRLFKNFNKLSVSGIMLYQGEKLVAFTFGEVLSRDTFLVHFEKADSDVNGAYPMINREFARYIAKNYPQIVYINREEDMGIEGLRRAKQSYYPIMMGKKYVLTKKSPVSVF